MFQKVSQTVFDELVHLASCEDACFTLLGYLDDAEVPEDAPTACALRSLHEAITLRMSCLVEHYKYEELPF